MFCLCFLRQTLTFSFRSSSSYRHCCGIDVVCPEGLLLETGLKVGPVGDQWWRCCPEVLRWSSWDPFLTSPRRIITEGARLVTLLESGILSVWFLCPPYLTIIAFMARHLTEDKLISTPPILKLPTPSNPELNKPGIIVPSPQLPTKKLI